MTNQIQIEKFGNRNIAVAGIGKMFYQDGFPISMVISKLKETGVEVSILHIADECLKNGWSAKTTFNKLKADFEDEIAGRNEIDYNLLYKFCYAEYEDQRDMIFSYLFSSENYAKEFLRDKILL